MVLSNRKFALTAMALLIAITGALVPVVGTDFYPTADVGVLKLHVRAARGTRLDGTEKVVMDVEKRVREIIPAEELRTINVMLGVPFGFNLAFVPSDNVSGADAEMLISLKGKHRPRRNTRRSSARNWPTIFPARSSISRPPTSSARC